MNTNQTLKAEQLNALGVLLHMALKEIQILIWKGRSEQAADLADALSQLPLRMFSPGFDWQHYSQSLNAYQEHHADNLSVNYVSMLQNIQSIV